MTITIGRCVLPDPRDVSSSGDVLNLSGVFVSTATTAANRAAEAQMREMQLRGMVDNPDEDVFPLVWSADDRFDGFYFVDGVSWSYVNDGSGALCVADWSASLRRVADAAAPLFERTSIAVQRTGAYSTFSGIVFGVAPFDGALINGTNVSTVGTVANTPDGSVMLVTGNSTVVTGPTPIVWSSYVEADAYHRGGAALEVLADDGNWYGWTGRQFPKGTTQYRLTNGRVRFVFDTVASTVTPEVWDQFAGPAAWESCPTVTGQYQVGGSLANWALEEGPNGSLPTIERNDPSAVVLKISNGNLGSHLLAIHAGDVHMEVTFTSRTSTRWGLKFTSSTASTSVLAGAALRQTTGTAGGNFVTLGTVSGTALDLVAGGILLSAGTTAASPHYIGVVQSSGLSLGVWSQFNVAGTGDARLVKR